MAKQNYKLSAQTLIFTALPSVEREHPYTSAVIKHWAHKHEDLVSTFQLAKVTSALKKLKSNHKVAVKLYNFAKNNIFVDNTR